MGGLPPLTEEQKQQVIDAYHACGESKAEAARHLGMKLSTFKNRYIRATKHESIHDLDDFISEGQKLRGVSVFVDKKNNIVGRWIKTNADLERQKKLIEEAAQACLAELPAEKPVLTKPKVNTDLASLYVITDYHIGMMAWGEESGEDWDMEKSCTFLSDWMMQAIDAAPASEVGILCQLGDFLHSDNIEPVTPTSKHSLDMDARFGEVAYAAVKALRIIIRRMLKKHKRVHVINAEGNHDISSSIWLRVLLAEIYKNEKRVTVDQTKHPYYMFEWGDTSLFFHHGHKQKLSEISRVMAALYRKQYGRTEYSYVHMGHWHHVASKEDSMMFVEQHPTMAPKDAYSARGGYLSKRGASVITYSKEHGEISRSTIRPEMIR